MMACPYCMQPIINPFWECHAELDFCSVECGMKFVIGERMLHLADLNQLESIKQLVLNREIQRAISYLTAFILDLVGTIVSRGRWTIGSLHIHCDDTDGWSWRIKPDAQQTRTG